MKSYSQISEEQTCTFDNYEVGFIVAFEDGRLDRIGHFPLPDWEPDPEPLYILKKIVELEPSTRFAGYIFVSIRLQKEYDYNPRTIELKKGEIKTLLRKLATPGIIRIG